jgi:hypothetical protein
LEELFRERGHILMMSVKGHCELAGNGIEYNWGKSKHHFRSINDCVPRNLHKNIKASLTTDGSDAVLPLARVRKFARKARSYRLIYKAAGLGNISGHADVERMYKIRKCHRSALDLDFKFIVES